MSGCEPVAYKMNQWNGVSRVSSLMITMEEDVSYGFAAEGAARCSRRQGTMNLYGRPSVGAPSHD